MFNENEVNLTNPIEILNKLDDPSERWKGYPPELTREEWDAILFAVEAQTRTLADSELMLIGYREAMKNFVAKIKRLENELAARDGLSEQSEITGPGVSYPTPGIVAPDIEYIREGYDPERRTSRDLTRDKDEEECQNED